MKPLFPKLLGSVLVAPLFLSMASLLPVAAQTPTATAVVTGTPESGSVFDYSILLTNTSSTSTIGTFWFAWIPGQSYLLDAPTNIVNPAGWSDTIITPGGPDAGGYSIKFDAQTLLAAGGTETFEFTSPETPQQLAGNSPFFSNPTVPEATYFVYSGPAFSSPSGRFVASVEEVPEPQSVVMVVVGVMALAILGIKRLGLLARR